MTIAFSGEHWSPDESDAGLVSAMVARVDRRIARRSGGATVVPIASAARARAQAAAEARWAAQDAELQRGWREMAVSATHGDRRIDEDWSASILGLGSVHGALEARLMRKAPNLGAGRYVLDELERHGGREWERRVVRLVALEWQATRYEIGLGIHDLITDEVDEDGNVVTPARAERVRSTVPAWLEADELTDGQRLAAQDWTGWDLRIVRKATR